MHCHRSLIFIVKLSWLLILVRSRLLSSQTMMERINFATSEASR
ncbi:unnamed protein product [Cylicostephanus goldi]|uniref:Uncharacterized protein n=1 Tax=Cylicostephanus goldi TaxID=71465 RepID=A0A3P7N5P2_CYLGO|nr:unnamed protein product [Cylicostephanus goldi]